MKIEFNKKYTTIAAYTIITFSVCLLLVVVVQNAGVISGYIKTIAEVLAPVTWGVVIAYLANPIMKVIERFLKKIFDKEKPHPKLTRGLATAFSLILILAALVALIASLLPQVIDSVVGIANNFTIYIGNFQTWIYGLFENYPQITEGINNVFNTIQPKIIETVNNIIPQLANVAVKLKDGAVVFILALKDFVIGFVVAIYLLCGKERFLAQLRKLVCAIFPKDAAGSIFNVAAHTNYTLSGFISGKIIDSFIIGVITFISMTIMKMDFVALISVVIGVTNIIPFFGPFIGAIPCAFLLLVAAPKQVIPFVIFIVILQQFDGNILGPKILGDSTGLSSFWVMVAIFLGGGLFGFAGMLLGVPVFAVIYSLVSEFLDFLLAKKGVSTNTDDYMPVPENEKAQDKSEFKIKYFEKVKNKGTEKNEQDAIEDNTDANSEKK